MIVELKGFGSARKLSGTQIELASASTIAQLRQLLIERLALSNDDALLTILQTCAFASHAKVLAEDDELGTIQTLNILPPVCGG